MGKCDAGSGVLFSACLPVSQSLRSDARCSDAGSGVVSPFVSSLRGQMPDVVSPACLPLSPSLRGQMPDAPGSCLPLVSLSCVSQSPRSDARCCLSPCVSQSVRRWLWGRVSPLSPCVSPLRGQSAEPCRALNMYFCSQLKKSDTDCFAQDSELLFGITSFSSAGFASLFRISRALSSL